MNINQHWFRWWLTAVRHQAWNNVNSSISRTSLKLGYEYSNAHSWKLISKCRLQNGDYCVSAGRSATTCWHETRRANVTNAFRCRHTYMFFTKHGASLDISYGTITAMPMVWNKAMQCNPCVFVAGIWCWRRMVRPLATLWMCCVLLWGGKFKLFILPDIQLRNQLVTLHISIASWIQWQWQWQWICFYCHVIHIWKIQQIIYTGIHPCCYHLAHNSLELHINASSRLKSLTLAREQISKHI